ncbi:MAG: HD-GYP domain-containing protein, partial [Thermoleophilaceae bacterium]
PALMTSTLLLDPEAEQLLEQSRERVERRLDARERRGEAVAAAAFLVAAVAVAALVPWQRPLDLPLALTLIASYALASRIKFELGPCYTNPTQLLLVPMLFLLPSAVVPLAVAAGNLLGEAPDYLTGRRHPGRALVAVADSWYAIGPALVLGIAGAGAPDLAEWPLYLGALATQLVADVATTTPREWLELGVAPRKQLADAAWTFGVDALLATAGLLAALATRQGEYAFLLIVPLLAVVAVFARERSRRLDSAFRLSDAYRGTTMLLADIVETDDEYTGLHSRTVVSLALGVAAELGLDAREQRDVEFGALLHDVGKIHVPKEIINKAGPLSPEEWALMWMHTVDGQQMLERVGGVLSEVGRIVRSSHERWDGGGYPDGLADEAIPIESRIITACDAFNAMVTDRAYRAAMSTSTTIGELYRCAGAQFDPRVVEALVAVVEAEPALAR